MNLSVFRRNLHALDYLLLTLLCTAFTATVNVDDCQIGQMDDLSVNKQLAIARSLRCLVRDYIFNFPTSAEDDGLLLHSTTAEATPLLFAAIKARREWKNVIVAVDDLLEQYVAYLDSMND
jgi:hypothetical protein